MEHLYNMIFKRKSVRRYDASRSITAEELAEIQETLDHLKPLVDIPVTFHIVKRSETNCHWGEYCLLAYSEEQEGYLVNIGYMLEQMDLFFASRNIGACWYGMGKPDNKAMGNQSFVIMMAFGRCKTDAFRQDISDARRKKLDSVCQGADDPALKRALLAAHYAPSAVNSQPWHVVCEKGRVEVRRVTGVRNPLLKSLVGYMNKIDMGIFLCFLELTLSHEGLAFQRTLLPEDLKKEPIPVAVYQLEYTAE